MYIIDSNRNSFVPGARQSEFPLQNLPYGIFSTATQPSPRAGVAIGNRVLDLALLAREGWLPCLPAEIFSQASLNALAATGRDAWTSLRETLAGLLEEGSSLAEDPIREQALIPLQDCTLHLPFLISEYTDFYASRNHAYNCGVLFRGPDNALPPNWMHMPIAYNGRASSIVVSGTPVRRPNGQLPPGETGMPAWEPTKTLDFELEVGVFIGTGTELGEPLEADSAEAHIFGLVLLNDWSARDVQRWEYVPLGPFQSKAFASSISPWVVPLDALEPASVELPAQNPPVLPYLQTRRHRSFDIGLTVQIQPSGGKPVTVSTSNVRHLYWSFAQQIAHHTSGGCNLRTGDLLGSGTISGTTPDSLGCLLEMSKNGTQPLSLADDVHRRFLEDGDSVTFNGSASVNGLKIGFGQVSGQILPANHLSSKITQTGSINSIK
ncbi:fumarylacetoacetase [Advenella sp. WQ 585]|uniref:fumarylacetoacetase n=1 Tax=Advenella mandrilli TaxID=2800330 RepID=A0ABS1EBX6_9BURK|nr:fumarylacetoacetase [Advenella mandrilli]MBK1779715.1 fumarylacetoacetase [Advenella mandrilli]